MVDKLYVMRDEVYSIGLKNLIKHIQNFYDTKNMDMIEIGSYAGESTQIFANHFNNVIAIDPFINDYDPNDVTCSFMKLENVYHEFKNVVNKFNNIEHIKKTSDEAFKDISSKSFHFVYIDGMHTYDQVKKDILNYLPLIKPNYFIGGHDYHENWIGVVNAVHEVIGKPDMIFEDTSWIKKLN
jgi:hypothetical protein